MEKEEIKEVLERGKNKMTKQEALRQAYTFIGQECDRLKENLAGSLVEIGKMVAENNEIGFMEEKGALLEHLVNTDLLTDCACPYCIFNDGECGDCSYGEKNGQCGNSNSAYHRLSEAMDDLQPLIDDYSTGCPEFVEAKRKAGRILVLGNIEVSGDQVKFQIIEQSHREEGFNAGDQCFTASNGFELYSAGYPAISTSTMFCRGHRVAEDDCICNTDLKNFTRIVDAVKEYNENKKEK